MAAAGVGGGGAIHVDAAGNAEWPSTSETKSSSPRPWRCSTAAMQSSIVIPPGVSSSADSRTPTAIGRSPTASRIAVSTSVEKRSRAATSSPSHPSPRRLLWRERNWAGR